MPWLVREVNGNNVDKVDLHKTFPGHVDIPRIKQVSAVAANSLALADES